MRACRTCVSFSESAEPDSLKIRSALEHSRCASRELSELDVRLAHALIDERNTLLITRMRR